MNEATPTRRRGLMWALVLGPWLVFAPLAVGFSFLQLTILGKPVNWEELFGLTSLDCTLLATATFIIYRLTQQFPFDRHGWRQPLFVHSCALVLFALCRSAALAPIYHYFKIHPELSLSVLGWFQVLFSIQFPSFLLIYWLIVGVCLAVSYHEKYRERELHASQLKAQLAQAQLQMLKMQLHPHFLFNTLNAISALMHQDVDLADRMIARLGELLRSTLENAGTQHVSLKQELEFIKPYLEIEQARLGPRLTVSLDIDPEVMDARVPNLLLQPLVENAIRHGIAPRAEPGRIEITAHRKGAMLELAVHDDGPGFSGTRVNGKKGIGLRNTQARLQQLYGLNHHFEIGNIPGHGLRAAVAIPFCETPEEAEPRTENHDADSHAHRG